MRTLGSLFAALIVFFSSSPFAVADGLAVVTTTPDLAAIARAIGGDLVKVESIAKGFQDPHYVEAKPSFMRLVNQARLLVYAGLQLEIGWLPLLVQGARNPGLVQVDASQGVPVLERPTGPISRAQGDVHPEGNPHYWLDPRNGSVIGRTIAQQLKALAPADAARFDQNLKLFDDDLNRRRKSWEERMAQFRGREIVAYHKQWEYLARWLGLTIVGYVEDKPGIPPAPQSLAAVVRTMQEKKIKTLLVANFTNPTIPQSVADKVGSKLVVLPASVGGEKGIDTYGDLFDAIVARLAAGLK